MLKQKLRTPIDHHTKKGSGMALSMTFWPNPVYRNHTAERRWYFHIAVRQEGAKSVHIWRYRGEWYGMDNQLQDTKEDRLDMHLAAHQHVSYPDQWVSSGLSPFRYRLILYGREEGGQDVQTEAVLVCQ